jgi:hypothetical protein
MQFWPLRGRLPVRTLSQLIGRGSGGDGFDWVVAIGLQCQVKNMLLWPTRAELLTAATCLRLGRM